LSLFRATYKSPVVVRIACPAAPSKNVVPLIVSQYAILTVPRLNGATSVALVVQAVTAAAWGGGVAVWEGEVRRTAASFDRAAFSLRKNELSVSPGEKTPRL